MIRRFWRWLKWRLFWDKRWPTSEDFAQAGNEFIRAFLDGYDEEQGKVR